MDHFSPVGGAMHAEAVALETIADAVGTPVYVYSGAAIEAAARAFQDAVGHIAPSGEPPLIAYAVKANPNGAVLATLARLGFGADVVSVGEMQRAIAAGVAAEKIVFSGVGKTEAEMHAALAAGIGQFNLESFEEAELLSSVAASNGQLAKCVLRVNPDVDAGTHAKISTGRSENKFGVAYDAAAAFFERSRGLPGLELRGVAVHIGSQLSDLAPLRRAYERVGTLIAALRQNGHTIDIADLGGGLGVSYDATQPAPPSPRDYGVMVADVTRDWNVRLAFEPGRVIVGNAGVLLSRVVRVKAGAASTFVITDAGMNDLLRPSLYDAWHDIRAVRATPERMTACVVGPVCETGDTFAKARDLAAVKEGDLVAFMTAGAYGATMASTYNSRPLAPEVMVHGDRFAVVRARKDVAALISDENVPDWLKA